MLELLEENNPLFSDLIKSIDEIVLNCTCGWDTTIEKPTLSLLSQYLRDGCGDCGPCDCWKNKDI
jgi:hypothetical protein